MSVLLGLTLPQGSQLVPWGSGDGSWDVLTQGLPGASPLNIPSQQVGQMAIHVVRTTHAVSGSPFPTVGLGAFAVHPRGRGQAWVLSPLYHLRARFNHGWWPEQDPTCTPPG